MLIGLIAFLLATAPQDTEAGRVEKWVASLDSEEAKVREDAEARLFQLGPGIRPILVAALPRLSPEQKGRIEAILQRFIIVEEDEYAIRLLKRGDAFPVSPLKSGERGEDFSTPEGTTVSEAVFSIAKRVNVALEFYAADTAFRREADEAPIQVRATTTNADVEWLLTSALTTALDACMVVDKERVVIVRMTPAVLLEKLALSDPGRSEIERHLEIFAGVSNRHWVSVGSFLQTCYSGGGPRFTRWNDALKSIALGPKRTVRDRCAALSGLRWFRGIDRRLMPDSAAVFIDLASDPKAPLEVRTEAAGSLAYCLEEEAQTKLLELLEAGAVEFVGPLLLRMAERPNCYLGALYGIHQDAARRARLTAALEKLEKHADRDVALRALSILSVFVQKGPALLRLAGAQEPTDPQTLRVFLDALRISTFSSVPEVWDRVDRLAAHSSVRMRASAAAIYGRSVGGTDRARDAKGALAMLTDKEPLVRWAAAEALRYVYMIEGAAEPYYDGWEGVEPHLQKAIGVETHPKVKESLEGALKRR